MPSTTFSRSAVMALSATVLAAGTILATSAPAPAQPATERSTTAAPADCPRGYFCLYKKPNYKDLLARVKDCYMQEIPDAFANGGSWYNNTDPSTKARFYDKHGRIIYTTPGAPSGGDFGRWGPTVWFFKPC